MRLPEGHEDMTDDELVAVLVADGDTEDEARALVDVARNGPLVD